ncbi:MAG: TIGR00159 family protein [Synergistaceae bacterium]|jgi:diadenylate cyclase|nr:TIGR00159 family protein [Synergistaceae bacterium]
MLDYFRWQDAIDILIISVIIHRLLLLIVGTRAMQLVKGLLIMGALAAGATIFDLRTLSWFLGKVLGVLVIAIPIVFQPELRKMLEELGRGGSLWRSRKGVQRAELLSHEVARAIGYLKGQKIGGLFVLERGTGLRDFWRTAIKLNADITQELLISIFWGGNPLHDGAVIMDRDKVIAASCYLPLTENTDLSRWIGTRHRAALGVTEVSDAISLVVSEERGEVSLAVNGHLSKNLKDSQVQKLLLHYFSGEDDENRSIMDRLQDDIRTLWS